MNLNVRDRDEPEVNLTSLIDVVFLLLIFFMVSTSFVKQSQLSIRLPQADNTSIVEEVSEFIDLMITEQGTYLVNGRALLDNRPVTLESAMRMLAGDNPGHQITVSADAEASHQDVITAMDIAGRLGYVEINLSTVQPDSN